MPLAHSDPITIASDMGVVIAWANGLRDAVLWFPDERMLVLDSSLPRRQLYASVASLLAEIAQSCLVP